MLLLAVDTWPVSCSCGANVTSYVHFFQSFGIDTTVDDTFRSVVVSMDWYKGLWVPQFLLGVANFNTFACIDI